MDKYLQILRAIRAGRKVSKEELSYFMAHHEIPDTASYEKLKSKLASEEGLASMSDDDFDKYTEEAKKQLASPEYKEKVLDIAKEAHAGRAGENVTRGLNLALAGTDLATSLAQISKSNQQLAHIQRPSRPAVQQRDQMLQQALSQAQAGTMDQSKALLPAQLGIQDAYRADLSNANTASAGQPGAYGAYAQSAINRRNRANLDLVPMANNIKQQEQARYDSLLGLRQNENQAISASQGANYGADLYQYGVDRQAANELGSVGRSNLRDSLTGFAAQIPGIARQYTRNKYDDLYNQAKAYGPDHAKRIVEANKYVDGLHNGWNTSDDSNHGWSAQELE